MFSPAAHVLNLTSWLHLGQLVQSRMQLGELAMTLNLQSGPGGEATSDETFLPRNRRPLSVALFDHDCDTWPWVRNLDHGDSFFGVATWFLDRQLAYPLILKGLRSELHTAYSWTDRLAIRYPCLMEEQILGILR